MEGWLLMVITRYAGSTLLGASTADWGQGFVLCESLSLIRTGSLIA